ncbi:MAG: acyl-CoA thioesterase [Myxococcota bacterium]
MSLHPFDRDTAVRRLADGAFEAVLDRRWWIVVGPNGGYLAAILLRALTETVGDATRTPRSLTVHYVSPAREGPVRVVTALERAGRSLSNASARLEQDGALVAVALAVFAKVRPSPEFADLHVPEVPPPESLPRLSLAGERSVPMREQLETRPAFGEPMRASSEHAQTGGWIRAAEPRLADAPFLALLCDAWPPAVAQHRALASHPPRGMPTVDLTIHFRAQIPEDARPEDFYLGVFRSRTLRAGFVEEDGEIWTRKGLLLAHSRQLAMLV